jgi:glutamine amidotransferase
MAAARPTIAVADLGSGNLRSVAKAVEAAGGAAVVSSDPDLVARADKLVVPGQGAFGGCAAGLDRGGGELRQAVIAAIDGGRPYFGICIGLQLLFEGSDEDPSCPGLAIMPGRVRKFAPVPGLKIPHMGWNQTRRGPARTGLVPDGDEAGYFYFVHSYYPEPARAQDVALTSEHGVRFCAAVARDNVFACQFHPEKSQAAGLALLRRFVSG